MTLLTSYVEAIKTKDLIKWNKLPFVQNQTKSSKVQFSLLWHTSFTSCFWFDLSFNRILNLIMSYFIVFILAIFCCFKQLVISLGRAGVGGWENWSSVFVSKKRRKYRLILSCIPTSLTTTHVTIHKYIYLV